MSYDYSHRKSSLKIKLYGKDNLPLAGKNIKIKHIAHEFLFASGGFDAVEYAGGNPDGTPLSQEESLFKKELLEKAFAFNNFATLPFYLGRYESVEGQPDEKRTKAAAKYFADRNIRTKGHPLCWHTAWADWLMEYSNKEILQKVIQRIERDVSAFKGLVDTWDVINEVVIMPMFDKYDNAITRLCKEIGRVPMVKEVFAAARRANPNAVLLLNDFMTTEHYEKLIEECLNEGISIDVIGIQSHQHKGFWGKEKLEDVLARFSRFNLPLHFTENTIISGDLLPPTVRDLNDWQVDEWLSTPEGEERQAREIEEFYSIIFSHPKVEAMTTWCPIDGRWLKAPAGFLRLDNSEKPSYHVLKNKITKEWMTELEVNSSSEGVISFNGFRGKYEINCDSFQSSFVLDGKKDSLDLMLV